MAISNTLVIFGATSSVAAAISALAIADGLHVIGIVRESSDTSIIEAAGAQVLRTDIMDGAALAALNGVVPEGAWVVSALGGKPGDTSRVDSVGNCNAIDAAVRWKASRFVLITTVGAGDSRIALPEQLLPILGPLAEEKTVAESHLKDSGLSYTILRPGHLTSDEPTGNAILVEDPRTLGAVTRKDLAALVLKVLREKNLDRRTLAVADRNRLQSTFPVTPFEFAGEAS